MRSLIAKFPDLPSAVLLLTATVAVFWPATAWVAAQAAGHAQLQQSFFLLLFAGVILWIDHRKSLLPIVVVARRSLLLLGGAFLLMVIGMIVKAPYLPLLALAVALAAFIHILFGDKGFNLTLPWIAGFIAFLFFVLLFHFLDWPLRTLAGGQAAQFLTILGYQTELAAIFRPDGMLLLSVNDRIYEVAAECNGFGLMSTSVVLALLLVVSRPLQWPWKLLAVVLAFAVGFAFNILRILGIVTLAPSFPAHYDLLHEAIGLTALFAGLAFLWWLLGGGRAAAAKDVEQPPHADSEELSTTYEHQ